MPKIERNQTVPTRRRRPLTLVDQTTGEEVRVSSVLFGIVLLVAIVVATAAWMGGSMSQVQSRFAGLVDDGARMAGVSVNDVSVIGLEADPVLADDVRDAAMIEPGENMFRADPHLIRRRVEATQKVLNVRVHRLWPDQIVIIAEAAEPVAVWHDGRRWAVVDGLGRVIPGARASDHTRLVKLAGAGGADAAPKLAELLGEHKELSDRVAIATRVAGRRWDMRLVTGVTVRLPEDAALESALSRLAQLETRTALSERPLAQVDLSHQGRVYLRRHPNAPQLAPVLREGADS
jgi:cell division protein FtsQ